MEENNIIISELKEETIGLSLKNNIWIKSNKSKISQQEKMKNKIEIVEKTGRNDANNAKEDRDIHTYRYEKKREKEEKREWESGEEREWGK